MSINQFVECGNLTRDAELRTTHNTNTPVINFSIAVNDRRKNPQSGEWEDVPNFFDCSMFGARAEKIHPYLTKGTKVIVSGRLRQSTWDSRKDDGEVEHRSRVVLLVDDVEWMSPRRNTGDTTDYTATDTDAPMGDYEEDVPF